MTFKNFITPNQFGLSFFIFPTITENLLSLTTTHILTMHIPSSKPSLIEFGSIPLSNLYFASVSISKILEVFLIDEG